MVDENYSPAMYCYSCYDQMMFQLYGQMRGYDPGQQSKLYLTRYLEEGQPVVKCDLCDRSVTYVWDSKEAKYLEVERPVDSDLPRKMKGEIDGLHFPADEGD